MIEQERHVFSGVPSVRFAVQFIDFVDISSAASISSMHCLGCMCESRSLGWNEWLDLSPDYQCMRVGNRHSSEGRTIQLHQNSRSALSETLRDNFTTTSRSWLHPAHGPRSAPSASVFHFPVFKLMIALSCGRRSSTLGRCIAGRINAFTLWLGVS